MSNKINLVFFVSSGFLSNYILTKLIKLRKKINIILLVSDAPFKKELKKNKFRNFSWIINRKNNETKILKKIEKYKNEQLYGFSLQYKWKIKKKIIEKFKYIFNFHFGDLPKYRGHNPIMHSIINNEKFICGVIHAINENLDKGLIFEKIKIKNSYKKVAYEYENIIANKFAKSFEKIINKILSKKKLTLKKIRNKKSHFYSIKDIFNFREIKKLKNIINIINAFDHPVHEPAFLKINNTKMYFRSRKV